MRPFAIDLPLEDPLVKKVAGYHLIMKDLNFSKIAFQRCQRIIDKGDTESIETMKIELKEITVHKLFDGYQDNDEGGVVGFGGKLDIRPPYQREFIYKDKQRDAVITTVTKDFPLNVMYWAVRDDGNFEVIDGQQRTLSLCQYVDGDFAYMFKYFENLQNDEKEKILNYKLMVYQCTGTDSERLQWFKIVNIAGEKLYDQELRNAVYPGSWVTNAKRYFSKNGCPAYQIGSDYLNGMVTKDSLKEMLLEILVSD